MCVVNNEEDMIFNKSISLIYTRYGVYVRSLFSLATHYRTPLNLHDRSKIGESAGESRLIDLMTAYGPHNGSVERSYAMDTMKLFGA